LGGGDLDFLEFFNSPTQITANRIARVDMTYSGGNPATEVWKIYDSDGTTVLRTITLMHTFVTNNWTKTEQATT
jgi:hypothetical protein